MSNSDKNPEEEIPLFGKEGLGEVGVSPLSPHSSPFGSTSRQDRLLRILSGEDRRLRAEWTRAGLWIIVPLYGLVIGAYRGMYDAGLLNQVRLPCPVIGIGNVTVGGTGKTGMAQTLARMLQSHGLRPAILNYGYRASLGKGPALVSDGEQVLLSPEEAGDEAAMLARSLPGVPVLIGKRRVESGALAVETFHPDALILDDGFQYWRLHKDVEIVLIDALQPWGYNALLPRGLLRELPSSLRRADAVVLTHTTGVSDAALKALSASIRQLNPQLPVFEANYAPGSLCVLSSGDDLPLNSLSGASIGALTALGNPDRFEAFLRHAGAGQIMPYRFPDHHHYRGEEIAEVLADAARRNLDFIVTTAKDAVKLQDLNFGETTPPVCVLDAMLQIHPEIEFETWLMKKLSSRTEVV